MKNKKIEDFPKLFSSYIFSAFRKKWKASKKEKVKYEGCILCGIVKRDKRIPREEVYRNKIGVVVLNIYPYNLGHLMIFPIRHVTSLEELTKEEAIGLFDLVVKSMKLIKETYGFTSFNIGINIGKEAGASIDHLHIQLVPRFKGETGFMETIAKTRIVKGTLKMIAKDLRKNVKKIFS